MYVTDRRPAREPVAVAAAVLRENPIEIERVGAHLEPPVHHRPLGARPIAIDLDAVAVRIGEIQRLADAVIRNTLQHAVGLDHPAQRAPAIAARRHENREVIEAGRAADARRVLALREREEIGSTRAEPRRSLVPMLNREPKMRFVEPNRSIEMGNGEMDLADAGRRIDHEWTVSVER